MQYWISLVLCRQSAQFLLPRDLAPKWFIQISMTPDTADTPDETGEGTNDPSWPRTRHPARGLGHRWRSAGARVASAVVRCTNSTVLLPTCQSHKVNRATCLNRPFIKTKRLSTSTLLQHTFLSLISVPISCLKACVCGAKSIRDDRLKWNVDGAVHGLTMTPRRQRL